MQAGERHSGLGHPEHTHDGSLAGAHSRAKVRAADVAQVDFAEVGPDAYSSATTPPTLLNFRHVLGEQTTLPLQILLCVIQRAASYNRERYHHQHQ